MVSDENLELCPFCGDLLIIMRGDDSNSKDIYYPYCTCGAFDSHGSKEECMKALNRRATPEDAAEGWTYEPFLREFGSGKEVGDKITIFPNSKMGGQNKEDFIPVTVTRRKVEGES